jgi:hypothetical protein
MQKTLSIVTLSTLLMSCAPSKNDSFNNVTPPPTTNGSFSNEAGPLQQSGGVASEIRYSQGGEGSNEDITIR